MLLGAVNLVRHILLHVWTWIQWRPLRDILLRLADWTIHCCCLCDTLYCGFSRLCHCLTDRKSCIYLANLCLRLFRTSPESSCLSSMDKVDSLCGMWNCCYYISAAEFFHSSMPLVHSAQMNSLVISTTAQNLEVPTILLVNSIAETSSYKLWLFRWKDGFGDRLLSFWHSAASFTSSPTSSSATSNVTSKSGRQGKAMWTSQLGRKENISDGQMKCEQ